RRDMRLVVIAIDPPPPQLQRKVVTEADGHGNDVSERVEQIERHDRRDVAALGPGDNGKQRHYAKRQVAADRADEVARVGEGVVRQDVGQEQVVEASDEAGNEQQPADDLDHVQQ